MSERKDRLVVNRIFKFLIVGSCSTSIDFIIYMLLSMKISITVSKGISMVCSSVFSYMVNKRFTFGNKEHTNIGYLIRFYLVFLVNLGTNMSVNYLLYTAMQSRLVAYIVATACGMAINYLGQRFIVFQIF